MEVSIDSQLYREAQDYAKKRGLTLSSVIEDFLVRFCGKSKTCVRQCRSDVALSLLGAGEPVAEDDINAREAYFQYLENKYQ